MGPVVLLWLHSGSGNCLVSEMPYYWSLRRGWASWRPDSLKGLREEMTIGFSTIWLTFLSLFVKQICTYQPSVTPYAYFHLLSNTITLTPSPPSSPQNHFIWQKWMERHSSLTYRNLSLRSITTVVSWEWEHGYLKKPKPSGQIFSERNIPLHILW